MTIDENTDTQESGLAGYQAAVTDLREGWATVYVLHEAPNCNIWVGPYRIQAELIKELA